MKHFEPNLRFCGTTSWKLISKYLIDRPPLTAKHSANPERGAKRSLPAPSKRGKLVSSPFVSQPSGSLSLNLFMWNESLERGWQIVNLGARANASALRM